MGILKNLQPTSVFGFFEEICSIPHTSFHEKELSDYCVEFAKARGLFWTQDEMGNVIIIKEATSGYENVEPMMLQGHLDMVGAKEADCSTDLEKDGLTLIVDGDFIHADRTTLGGDDGIAVAYALAILDAEDISHPRVEVVLTVSEEVGLLGASAIDLSVCKAKRLLNIDSEDEGILTVGCAGGRRTMMKIPVKRESAQGILCRLQLEGLKGGHSGMEIHKGRANANNLLGRFLQMLGKKTTYKLAELSGGSKENVIPSAGSIHLLMEENELPVLEEVLDIFHKQMEAEYGAADPGIRMIWEKGDMTEIECLTNVSLDTLVDLLNLHPNGVQAMSADLEGLVETSINLGVVELQEKTLVLRASIRSSVSSAKEYLADKLTLLAKMAGGSITFSGDYPAWPYARNSRLREICVEVFEKQYGRKPEVTVIHAGLECGILSTKTEGLDCVSIGPDLMDIHSPQERVSISSVQRTWEYVKGILAAK